MTKNKFQTKATIDVLDVRPGADGCRTGKGAGFLTVKEARADFADCKRLFAVPKGEGDFMLDLHVGDEIVDTIEITQEGYRQKLGEKPKSVEENLAFDRAYWARVQQAGKVADDASA